MNITIVGGGNIGTQFAVHCAEKGHFVTVYTSSPELYDGHLEIVDNEGVITHEGNIKFATADPDKAFKTADLIIVTMPATMMKAISQVIYEHSKKDVLIGVVPGNGGSECAFRPCIERGNTFFGIERVPAIARLVKKGKTVKSTGYRQELHVAAIPREKAQACAEIIGNIFEIKCAAIPNYLNLTMTPSNPILHTTRLKCIFNDWREGMYYDYVPLFYEEWDDTSSELLIACDNEVQSICKALPDFDLRYVKSLQEHYESNSVDAMTKKIASIEAFKGLVTPTVQKERGLIPDLHSRYFTADFSFGLTIIKQIASFAGVNVPNIDETMEWYNKIAIDKNRFSFEDYNMFDLKDLKDFYLR